MTNVSMKQGDTAVRFTDTLTLGGNPVNLTGATVRFKMRSINRGEPAFSVIAAIVSAAAGTVAFGNPLPGNFPAVAGRYQQEWEVTFGDNTVLTFPSNGFNLIEIIDDI